MPKIIPTGIQTEFYRLYTRPLQLYEIYTDPNISQPTHFYVANNQDITFGGKLYTALAIKRGSIKSEEGTIISDLEVGLDNVDLEFKNLIAGGYLSRKRIVIKLVFNGYLTSSANYITLLDGFLDEPKGDDNWVTMTVKPFPLFEREYPRRLFQTGCNWYLGDDQCTISKLPYRVEGTIIEGGTAQNIAVSGGDDNAYVPGYFVITESGHSLEGVSRPIALSDSVSITLRVALPQAPEVGTSFVIQKICAKNIEACEEEFDNLINFGGFPYTPIKPVL
jgi:uncharacterized phage protein (TIGR02218 family)